MKIIILAAGVGSRLMPLTENTPKSLLHIDNNTNVLQRTIEMINRTIECEIIVVTGYCKDKINSVLNKYDNCISISNPFYRVTNSIASLWFTKDMINEDTIILNADVIVEEKLLEKVINTKSESCVFYDSSIFNGADYKVVENHGNIVVMSKELTDYSGEYAGISKFSMENIKKVFAKIDDMLNKGLYNEWYETALVDMIFNNGFILEAIDISEYQWTEIDCVNDLLKAQKIFKSDLDKDK